MEGMDREEVRAKLYDHFRHRLTVASRAAERYADITDDELVRRRQRGWGDSVSISQVL